MSLSGNVHWLLINLPRRLLLPAILWMNLMAFWFATRRNLFITYSVENVSIGREPKFSEDTLIIVITPTHYRLEQLADLTRFSQTLRLIPRLHWIVVEDSSSTSATIEKLLNRSTLNYTHLAISSEEQINNKIKRLGKGWRARNQALKHLRSLYKTIANPDAVLYFADDDNSYDIRLFNEYVRKVKTVGVWAVALVGGALVEEPLVDNGTVVGFNVLYAKQRKFAVDMAGFAVHLRLILSTDAIFDERCLRSVPETCFLEQLNITREQLEPFGCEGSEKEILVWHTKTSSSGKNGPNLGYVIV